MKINFNKNKKSIILLGMILLTIIISIIILISNNKNNDQENDTNTLITNVGWKLPNINEINYNNTPMLYDFVNGSLGYKYEKDNFTDYGIFYCIAIKDNENKGIYISSYDYAEEIIYPILGKQPLYFDVTDLNLVHSYINNMTENRIIKEGDYTFCIVSLYKIDNCNNYDYCKNNKWANINILNSNNSEDGEMYNIIQKNGWPTDWLRRDYFKESIKKDGIDISNEFFDKYNIYQVLTFYKNGDKDKTLEVKVTNINKFEFIYNNGNKNIKLNLKESELNAFLEGENYEKNEK